MIINGLCKTDGQISIQERVSNVEGIALQYGVFESSPSDYGYNYIEGGLTYKAPWMLERIKSDDTRNQLAEFANSLSSSVQDVKFIFCGIGSTIDALLGAHRSAFRKIETIELERLRHDELWRIISSVGDKLGVAVDSEILIRIGQLSDGFPHYVHLIGESMFWSAFDDDANVSSCLARHYEAGVKGALERTEAEHKSAYQKATQKSSQHDPAPSSENSQKLYQTHNLVP